MTTAEALEAQMRQAWGERNVSRLARESGLDRSYVYRVLSGKVTSVQPKTAEKLAAVFGISPDVLLPPEVERPTLALVLRRLEALEAALAHVVETTAQILELNQDSFDELLEREPEQGRGGRRQRPA